jgi:ubiquitin-conjugating enzyme E2 I
MSIMSGIALNRLEEERKAFVRDHPQNFIARPVKNANGQMDLLNWECAIPGCIKTPWEGGLFEVTMNFSLDYPTIPPVCKFKQPIFHPNVFPSGLIGLDFLVRPEIHWRPTITIKQILLAIHTMLAEPDENNPSNAEACAIYCQNRSDYDAQVRSQAAEFSLEKYKVTT